MEKRYVEIDSNGQQIRLSGVALQRNLRFTIQRDGQWTPVTVREFGDTGMFHINRDDTGEEVALKRGEETRFSDGLDLLAKPQGIEWRVNDNQAKPLPKGWPFNQFQSR